jgi:hypothetical protein
MTFPTKPKTPYDYVAFQTNNPTDPLPANQVAGDFASHKTSIDAVIEFQKLVQRSDGRLNKRQCSPRDFERRHRRPHWQVGAARQLADGNGVRRK